MARKTTKPAAAAKTKTAGAFQLRKETMPGADAQVHLLGPGIKCDTEARGHASPQGESQLEILVDASEGFIPLWAKGTIIRWRFRERSMSNFADPTAAKKEIRKLFGEALLAWDTAVPVKFKEDNDVWDFEFVMRKNDDCDDSGCTLASAFFPDAGRHEFVLYPMLFTQDRKEQVSTFIHEIGHIFGLRHFFAQISETDWPSEIFGKHSKFSVMNYGNLSKLTDADKLDLAKLYKAAWAGTLTNINTTRIQFVQPYSTLAATGNRPPGH